MSRLRPNDRELVVGMVQARMTHQAATDHFDVSRKNISRLIIRLRKTGRTNDRSREGKPRVTSRRQDRH
jgi:transposase